MIYTGHLLCTLGCSRNLYCENHLTSIQLNNSNYFDITFFRFVFVIFLFVRIFWQYDKIEVDLKFEC